jgi:trypsin
MRRWGRIVAAASALLAAGAMTTPADAIVGGRATGPGEGAYTVALLSGDGSLFCGGSLVGSTWVLTAAHCAVAVADGSVPGPVTVAIGRSTLSGGAGQVHQVAEVLVHPGYDDAALVNDAALLRLTTASGAPTVRLAGAGDNAYEAHGTPVRVYGWGRTLPELPALGLTPTSDQLRVVDVPIVGDAQCQQQYGLLSVLTGTVSGPHHVCAAALLKDSCGGDSGGPLVATSAAGDVQLGIVSFGFGCALPTHAGVYTEVNAPTVRTWITQVAGV